MRSSSYPSTSKAEKNNSLYAHPVFWWSTKVICGAALIASLFLMVIYELPVWFSVPTMVSQALVLTGASISLWHYRILKRAGGNMSIPTRLSSRKGWFRWIRHPMYLADMIAYTGLFLLLPNFLTLPVIVMAYVALVRQAQVEDVYIAARFPSEFERWKQSSRVLFPFIY